ncbi:MAG: lmo0937 family membrane protein [Solirubrobacteraceae bacterium]
MGNLLWTVIVVLFAFWLLGLLFHIGGALIHLVLVVAIILIVINFLTGRGARV